MRVIRFYQTASGTSPVEEFLDSLPDREAQKVTWVLRLLERLDLVPQQYFKKLIGTEHLLEIRTQFGSNNYRFLCFFDGPRLLIVTNGFSKKQQKTPSQEIELAHRRRTDYLRRRIPS